VFRKLSKEPPKSVTDVTPVCGGQIESFNEFLRQTTEQRSAIFSPEVMGSLVRNHGSEYKQVLQYVDENSTWAETVGISTVIKQRSYTQSARRWRKS